MKRIILDTDVGTDDAIALMQLLLEDAAKNIKLEMIVCTRGNTTLENASKNAIRLLETANRTDIPVYKGSNEVLIPHTELVEKYHGEDGFGDLEHNTEPNMSIIRPQLGLEAMKDLICSNPRSITMVCVGPLTNLALLLRVYGNVAGSIKDIWIMGGNHLGVGNSSAAAEFNWHMDPEAAHIVLSEARCPINILTWECCMATGIPMKWRMENFRLSGGPMWRLIDRAERSIYRDADATWMPCDAFLTSALLYSNFIGEERKAHATVELYGRTTRGQCVLDHLNKLEPNVNLIVKINYHMFMDIIEAQHSQI